MSVVVQENVLQRTAAAAASRSSRGERRSISAPCAYVSPTSTTSCRAASVIHQLGGMMARCTAGAALPVQQARTTGPPALSPS